VASTVPHRQVLQAAHTVSLELVHFALTKLPEGHDEQARQVVSLVEEQAQPW